MTYIIADNQYITRAGLLFLLQQQSEVTQLVIASNKQELIQQLRHHPEAAIILDYTLFDTSTADELLVIASRYDQVRWLLFSDELTSSFLRQIIYSSERFSIVMKEENETEINRALAALNGGDRYLSPQVVQQIEGELPQNNDSKPQPLTKSECAILKEIALGKSTKEIANEKNLSFHTVNSHRKNIFKTLKVNNAQEAVRQAIKSGIIELMEYYI